MMFPWCNSQGATGGLLFSFSTMIAYIIGINLNEIKAQLPNQRLPISTMGCDDNAKNNTASNFIPASNHDDWKTDSEYSSLVQLLSFSFIWYSLMGAVLAVVIGLGISFLTIKSEKSRKLIDKRCICPPILKMLEILCPSHIKKWVDVCENK